VRKRRVGRQYVGLSLPGVAPKLANIEIGEISLEPKLSDIWCRFGRQMFVTLGSTG
jgi:hypothetical protein